MKEAPNSVGSDSNSSTISTKLKRIAKLAKEAPGMAFTTLAHHIDMQWLREAYRRTRKGSAPGVDGQMASDYAANLETNLKALLERAKSGRYRAPAVRRIQIPKDNGEQRPIGIPTFEDKVLQRAVTMVLEAVYEQDFLDCSYGFRPGRSAHQALDDARNRLMEIGGGWVLEIDIRKFFDTIDRKHLGAIVRHRVRDGVLLRLIGKWLNAGVWEDGELSFTEAGTPQGGVISPLLANVFLHEVLDTWFVRDVVPRLRGAASLYRYADDAIMIFEREDDARRVFEVLPKRFLKYGLELHSSKTRLIEFRRPDSRPQSGGRGRPETFDLLGFTHYWAKSRRGYWVVKQRTASSRLRRALHRLAQWCRNNRHHPIEEQHSLLSSKLLGHYQYYGVIGNFTAIERYRWEAIAIWRKWLSRRSQRAQMTWQRLRALLQRFSLPPARLRPRPHPA